MFQDVFEKLEVDAAAGLIERLGPLLQGATFDPLDCTIMAVPLSFYPGHKLYDIADHAMMPPIRRYAVCSPSGACEVLDFTSAALYALNARAGLKLDHNTVQDYVRFFLAHVITRHGRYRLTESLDDIPWKDDPPPNARKAIGKMLTPLTYIGTAEDGRHQLGATVTFKSALFRCGVSVHPETGRVDLHDEEMLVEDMPLLDDTFGQ